MRLACWHTRYSHLTQCSFTVRISEVERFVCVKEAKKKAEEEAAATAKAAVEAAGRSALASKHTMQAEAAV